MNVLVAGLTGQLGAGLAETVDGRLRLLPVVRRVGRLDPAARIQKVLPRHPEIAACAVAGDVTAHHWALGEEQLDALAGEVDAVLNLAGETNWGAPSQRLRSVNALGAQRGLELAAELRRRGGRCGVYCYASSVHVAGGAIGRVPERRLAPDARRTAYEHSKWLGEEAVYDGARRADGLTVGVARISALIGSASTGETAARNALYRLTVMWRRLPGQLLPVVRDARVDVLPRDEAGEVLGRAVEGLGRERPGSSVTFSVCAGDAAPSVDALLATLRSLDTTGEYSSLRAVNVPHWGLRWTSQNLERFDHFSLPWRNAIIGHRYLAMPRVFERDRLAALAGEPLPAPSTETIVRLAFGLAGPAPDPVPSARPLARYAG